MSTTSGLCAELRPSCKKSVVSGSASKNVVIKCRRCSRRAAAAGSVRRRSSARPPTAHYPQQGRTRPARCRAGRAAAPRPASSDSHRGHGASTRHTHGCRLRWTARRASPARARRRRSSASARVRVRPRAATPHLGVLPLAPPYLTKVGLARRGGHRGVGRMRHKEHGARARRAPGHARARRRG
eukprot:scaffold58355_cov66-Phaeocystis_antarctica.AAC.4